MGKLFEFDIDDVDVFIIKESLKSLLDDLEYERRQMSSIKEITESGIANEIHQCQNALKSIGHSDDLDGDELLAICIALLSFIDLLETNISELETSTDKNVLLDLKRDTKKTFRKLKPFYDSLDIADDI